MVNNPNTWPIENPVAHQCILQCLSNRVSQSLVQCSIAVEWQNTHSMHSTTLSGHGLCHFLSRQSHILPVLRTFKHVCETYTYSILARRRSFHWKIEKHTRFACVPPYPHLVCFKRNANRLGLTELRHRQSVSVVNKSLVVTVASDSSFCPH